MSVEKQQKLIKDGREKKKSTSNTIVRNIQEANSTETFGASLRQFFKINPEEKDKQKVVTILEKIHKKEQNYREALYYLISQVKFLDGLIISKPQVSEEKDFIIRLAGIEELLNKKDLPEWLRNIKDFIDRQKMKTIILKEVLIKPNSKVSSDVTISEPCSGLNQAKVENQTTISDPTKLPRQKIEEKSGEKELIQLSEKIEMLCRKYELDGENSIQQLAALEKKLRDMTINFEIQLSEKIKEDEKNINEELRRIKQERDIAFLELKKLKDKSKSKMKKQNKNQFKSLEKKEIPKRQIVREIYAKKIEEPSQTVPSTQIQPALGGAQIVPQPQTQEPTQTVPNSSAQPTSEPLQTVTSRSTSPGRKFPLSQTPQPQRADQPLPRSLTPVKQQRSRTPRREVISSTPQTIVDFLSESEIVSQTNQADIRFLKSKIGRLGKTKIKSCKLLFTSKNKEQKNVHTYFDNRTCILFLVKLSNGVIVGAYSRQSFHPNCSGNIGFIFNLTRREAFEKVQGSTISYHEESIVFGKSELRIKVNEMSLYSNFGAVERNFLSNNKDINYFLGCGEARFTEFQVLQIFQMIEE